MEEYYITNGRAYLMIGKDGGFTSTTNPKKAKIYDYTKGNNAVNNLKTSFKQMGYHLEKKPDNRKLVQVENNIDSFDFTNFDFIEDVFKKILDYEEICKAMVVNKNKAIEELSKMDRIQQDYLHACENYNYNACEGFKFYKELQAIRKRRRSIKKFLEIATLLEPIYAKMKSEEKLSSKVKKCLEGNKYHPRECVGLFKEEDIF